jgi:hypothetical protein
MAYRWLGVLALLAACSLGCENTGSGDPRGDGGTGGTAGAGGSQIPCTTSVLCVSCPSEGFCDTNDDCFDGLVCIESGCDSLEGVPIKRCVFAGGGACHSNADCPSGRDCVDVPEEGKRCIKTTLGCDTRFDCVLGFSCEGGNCVDRGSLASKTSTVPRTTAALARPARASACVSNEAASRNSTA